MTGSVTLAFLHHLAAFVLVAMVTVELFLVRGELTLASARTLLRVDAVYGVCAGAILVIGGLRVAYFEKPATYYLHSGAFWAKMTAFLIVGLISIYPTMQFLGWRKALAQGQLPAIDAAKKRRLRRILHWELVLLTAMLLCAAMMARGVGFLGGPFDGNGA